MIIAGDDERNVAKKMMELIAIRTMTAHGVFATSESRFIGSMNNRHPELTGSHSISGPAASVTWQVLLGEREGQFAAAAASTPASILSRSARDR